MSVADSERKRKIYEEFKKSVDRGDIRIPSPKQIVGVDPACADEYGAIVYGRMNADGTIEIYDVEYIRPLVPVRRPLRSGEVDGGE